MSDENGEDEILMHFVIPYDWKGTLRGLFWINIGIIVGFSLYVFILTSLGKLSLNDSQAQICMVGGYIIFIAIYLLIRHATVKYDKIKEPMRVWIYPDRFVFKSNYEVVGKFTNIKRVEVTINDKVSRLQVWWPNPDRYGNTGWIYGLKKANVEKGKYKYYIEKYWIPSMRVIVERIKELNPNVEVSWSDVRKKYK